MSARRIAAIVVAASALLCFGLPQSGAEVISKADSSWTIMVYMANDFDVANPLPWDLNVNSMEAASQAEGVSVIVLVDNSVDGDSRLLKIEHDPNFISPDTIVSTEIDDENAVIPVSGEVNMADPSTLTSFIVFSATEYPADRLILFLWGHGDAWRGLCPDKSDILTIPELATAFTGVEADLGRSVDMVVVDACVGATMEMLVELAPHVQYFVGSQTAIPSSGLPYQDILERLTTAPSQSPEDFATAIVDEYIDFSWRVSLYSATMAAFDLLEIGAAISLLDQLSIEGVRYGSIFHSIINEALASAEYYDAEWQVDLVDLLSIMHESELPLELRTLAIQTAVAFREAIVAFDKYDHPDPYDGVSVGRANGVVIYAPTTSLFEAPYLSLAISTTTHWDEFSIQARLVMPTEPMAPGPSMSSRDSDQDGLVDTIFLQWIDGHSLVEAWVFSQMPNGIVLRDSIISTGSNITIQGFVGNMVIAASAMDSDGSAVSYTTLNAAMYGRMRLDIYLTRNGVPFLDEGFDVQIVSKTYSGYAMPKGNAQTVTLVVPTQASVGEMVVVRVMDGDEVVTTARLVIGGQNTVLTVEVFEKGAGGEWTDDLDLLALSLLPALLVGIFAALLYIDFKRPGKGG